MEKKTVKSVLIDENCLKVWNPFKIYFEHKLMVKLKNLS